MMTYNRYTEIRQILRITHFIDDEDKKETNVIVKTEKIISAVNKFFPIYYKPNKEILIDKTYLLVKGVKELKHITRGSLLLGS